MSFFWQNNSNFMKIKFNLSPNFSKKTRNKKSIRYVIIHYTGMQSEIESIKRLKDPKSRVSCHYLISKNGSITQLVMENKVAWHAGKSKWKKLENLNQYSIGIELVNKGHNLGYEKFSKLQVISLIKLCKKLKKKYQIKKENFLGHSDIAPHRKNDPGEKFPWKKMSEDNLGIWYKKKSINFKIKKHHFHQHFFKNIYKIGYRYFKINKRSSGDKLLIKAFQRRFVPDRVTGVIDHKTLQISQFLAKNY